MPTQNDFKNTHFFVTNRYISDDGEIDNEGTQLAQNDLRFGTYSFNDENDEGYCELMTEPELARLNPEADTSAFNTNKEQFPSVRVFNKAHESMVAAESNQGHVLFFIHGFNCSFEKSKELIKKLHKTYVEDEDSPIKTIVAFCWPSNGSLLEYRDDAEDAIQSGKTLGRMYFKLMNWFGRKYKNGGFVECDQKIHLMAHSMGACVLESMIATLNMKQVIRKSIFQEAIIVGADVDYDSFENPRPLYNLIDLCSRVHIYFHEKDRALTISENTKNSLNRLGKWGCKNSNVLPDDVYQCNITDLPDDEGSLFEKVGNHWAYYSSSYVVEDVKSVLIGGASVFYA